MWPEPETSRAPRCYEHPGPRNPYLVAGVDSSGAYLFVVREDGEPLDFTSPGFTAIGNGAVLATAILYCNPLVKDAPLEEGVYCVYEAKRAAECLESVGKTTDMVILKAGRQPVFLAQEDLRPWEELYESRKPRPLCPVGLEPIVKVLTAKGDQTSPDHRQDGC
jgi:hypothetical protein